MCVNLNQMLHSNVLPPILPAKQSVSKSDRYLSNQSVKGPFVADRTQMYQFIILFDNACDKIINDTLRIFFQFAIRWIVLTTSVTTFRVLNTRI